MKRVIVTVAHGDDETNGMGGTILALKKAGWAVTILYATLPTDLAKAFDRKTECEAAAAAFGAISIMWDEPDGSISDDQKTRRRMTELMDEIRPDLVLSLWGIDVHPDHRVLSSLTLGYTMQKGRNVEHFACELCSSGRHTSGDRPQSLGFHPTHYVPMDEYQDQVAEITRCHASQDPEAMILGMERVHQNRAQETGGCKRAEGWVRLTRVGPLQHGLDEIFVSTIYTMPRSMGVDFLPETIGL